MFGNASSFTGPATQFLMLNANGTPANANFSVPASQVTGLVAGQSTDNLLNLNNTLTGLTGGGPTNLDGVPTVNVLDTNYTLGFVIPGVGLTVCRLELDSTAAGTGVVTIVPLDHDPVVNPRSWRQRL